MSSLLSRKTFRWLFSETPYPVRKAESLLYKFLVLFVSVGKVALKKFTPVFLRYGKVGLYLLKNVWMCFEVIFSPKTIASQLFALMFLQFGYELTGFLWRFLRWKTWSKFTKIGREAMIFQDQMQTAKSYSEWRKASLNLSKLLSSEKDAKMTSNELKVYEQVTRRNKVYERVVAQKITDVKTLRHLLRSDLLRQNFKKSANFLNNKTNVRLQAAIKNHQTLISDALTLLAQKSKVHSTPEKKGDLVDELLLVRERIRFFEETQQSFGNSALLLSGGAALGLRHVGVVKALFEEKLLPRVLSGSSAGSIVCGMVGASTDKELLKLFDPSQLNLRFFGREDSLADDLDKFMQQPDRNSLLPTNATQKRKRKPGILRVDSTNRTVTALLPQPLQQYFHFLRKLLPEFIDKKSFLDAKVLQKAIRDAIGDITFLEAYKKTGRIINITVTEHKGDSETESTEFPRLLNYLTTPDILIWSACAASCSLPGVFEPSKLFKKLDNEVIECDLNGVKWKDGSIENDLPAKRIKEMFDINHFIVSQVNPHAKILAPHTEIDFSGRMPNREANFYTWTWRWTGRVVMFLRDQLRSYAKHLADCMPFQFLAEIIPLLTQKYHGDITITTNVTLADLKMLLRNPTREQYKQLTEEGQQMTFPHIPQIRQRCMMEFMLNDCVVALKNKESEIEQQLFMCYKNNEKKCLEKSSLALDDALSPDTRNLYAKVSGKPKGAGSKVSLKELPSKLSKRVTSVAAFDPIMSPRNSKNQSNLSFIGEDCDEEESEEVEGDGIMF
eukprot:maker-scaffold_6-snap-gene-4.19-mRNA-1 protein AED:0.00 eAED:0.00 QI:111/1/1/1/1/1/2/85/783